MHDSCYFEITVNDFCFMIYENKVFLYKSEQFLYNILAIEKTKNGEKQPWL